MARSALERLQRRLVGTEVGMRRLKRSQSYGSAQGLRGGRRGVF